MLTQDSEFFGGFLADNESNFEGESQIIGRDDDNSLSSFSDSDETFLSDKISEKDDDLPLEGLSFLLGESVQNNVIPDKSIKGDVPPATGKEVVEEVTGCLGKDAHSPNELDFKRDRRMEWENAQALLTQMGIQLIHDTKETKKDGMINKARGKKGSRELQNLRFNVNYEGSSSSRGIPTSP